MQTCTWNFRVRPRREWYDGKEYLRAPATLLVPGTVFGSKGPLHYPADEIAKNFRAWDGVPITIGHPRTAYTCAVPNAGRVANARIASGGRLVADLMIDVLAANHLDRRIVKKLLAGEPIEVSTGLFTTNEPSHGYDHKNRRYEGIARAHKPDHLALLLDQTGACSVDDGCGVLMNQIASVRPLRDPQSY